MNKILKVGTDFSGIGSPEQALIELQEEGVLNFKSQFMCDIDKYARKSYEALYGGGITYTDITKRNHSEVPKLDLYVAGFPCQAFSLAGKRMGFEETRGTLFFNVAEFIKINQPECFILENVKGLLSHDSGKTFSTIISILSDNGGTVNGQHSIPYYDDGLGYHVYYQVLNTKEHGLPQNRERIFIVGFKKERDYRFPLPEKLNLKLKDVLEKEVDEKYYLSEKMLSGFINKPTKGFENRFKPLKRTDDTANTLSTKGGSAITDNFIQEGFINQDTQASKVFSEEGTSPTLSSGTHGYANGYVQVKSATSKGYEEAKEGDSINYSVPNSKTRRGRVGKGVAQTLDTACNQSTIIKDKIRRLTPLECWRLQGFPDEQFYKAQQVNSDTQLYKQAGNSISVPVIKKVIKNIYK